MDNNRLIALYKCIKPITKKIVPKTIVKKVKKIILKRNEKLYKQIYNSKPDYILHKPGINLIGDIYSIIGLGQSMRLLANVMKNIESPFLIYDYKLPNIPRIVDGTWDKYILNYNRFGINLIHINPCELQSFVMEADKSIWMERYNIGFWLWELELFPDEWVKCIDMLDEIWTPSEFASESIRRVTKKPVYTVPYCVEAEKSIDYDRNYFSLPDNKFLYLVMYDFNSTSARKNPEGALKAFIKAFSVENDNVGIVIKINNANKNETEYLKNYLIDYKNVYIIAKNLTKLEVNSLIFDVNVFISLHRAEGFGLVMAEAMILGTPCIATNWSSNTEFMNNEVACMVDYSFVNIEKNMGHYKVGNRWAEPNIEQASMFIRKLYEDKDYYYKLCENAKTYIIKKLGMNNAKGLVNKRIDDIINCL